MAMIDDMAENGSLLHPLNERAHLRAEMEDEFLFVIFDADIRDEVTAFVWMADRYGVGEVALSLVKDFVERVVH
jgi:hypothetical protein